jgi:hypothetical protein
MDAVDVDAAVRRAIGSAGPALGDVALNQFHADFTREYSIPK